MHKKSGNDSSNMKHLSREGQELREKYADREAAASYQREAQKSREKLQDCQIRLKWSRKKMIAVLPSTPLPLCCRLWERLCRSK
jgi:hypothetical protein